MARDSETLDLNSPYAYLLLAWHFPDTCVVAELGGRIVGFVAGYRPPTSPEAVFVWQVAVDADQRGNGLGQALLDAFVETPGARDATHLEATVTPSNTASWRLFRGFASRHGAALEEHEALGAPLFPPGHEAEHLVRIGPLPRATPQRSDDMIPTGRTNRWT